MLTRELRQKQSRNLRFVGKWFIPDLRQIRYDCADFRGRDAKLGVFGTQMARHLGRMRCLIILGFAEADREGAHGLCGLRLHQCNDGRGIDAAGKKCPKRHIGQALTLDGDRQKALEFVDRFGFVRDALALHGDDLIPKRPVLYGHRHRSRLGMGSERHECCRRQLSQQLWYFPARLFPVWLFPLQPRRR